MDEIAGSGIEALGFLGVAAAGRDDLAALQERIGDRDRLVEQPAGVVAQVDHEALELLRRDLRGEIGQRLLQAVGGLLVELRDADVADLAAFDAGAHRAHADDVAHDRNIDRLVLALAHDLQPDLGVDRPAHLVDRLVEGEALDRLVVEMGDDVAGHDAGLGGRGVVDRRHHLDQTVLHGDFDAEPAEFPAGLHLHVAEALGVHVARMRIQRIEHAVDGRFDQLAVIRLLDIVGAHALEHVPEQIELPVGVGTGGGTGARAHERKPRLGGEQGEGRAGGRAEENQRSLAHHPRTFSLSLVAHHGFGSTGVPSLRNST